MHYNIMDSLLFFLIYGFLGFLLETTFRSIADRKVYISRGFLTNGFCPLYGICALLIIEGFILCELALSNPLTAMIVATAGSMFLVTLIEYIVGRMLDRVFHYKLWDYSAYRLNLHHIYALNFHCFGELWHFCWYILCIPWWRYWCLQYHIILGQLL